MDSLLESLSPVRKFQAKDTSLMMTYMSSREMKPLPWRSRKSKLIFAFCLLLPCVMTLRNCTKCWQVNYLFLVMSLKMRSHRTSHSPIPSTPIDFLKLAIVILLPSAYSLNLFSILLISVMAYTRTCFVETHHTCSIIIIDIHFLHFV